MEDDIPYYVSEYRDTYENIDDMPDIIDSDAEINLFGISVCRMHILKAKEELEAEGIKVNVLNVMWLKPFNFEKYKNVMLNTSLGLVVEPGREMCGAAESIAFNLMKQYPGSYVDILGVEDKIKTTNPNKYNEVPDADRIVKKVHELLVGRK
jgi:transketolase C-terminal domain/subunit